MNERRKDTDRAARMADGEPGRHTTHATGMGRGLGATTFRSKA